MSRTSSRASSGGSSQPAAGPTISAVLPAYNEEPNLARTVRELGPHLRRNSAGYEILVIDDGSSDRTAEVAAQLSTEIPELRLLAHPRNLGYGAALRTGFAAAAKEWVLLLDADGQFLPQEVERLVAESAAADLVIGYRQQRADPGHRRFFAGVWRILMRLVLGVRVRDTNCGFKLMRTRVLQMLDLQARGALISAELLAKAARAGAIIVEVPVTHVPRAEGKQTGGGLPVLVRAYYELALLGWRIRRFRADARTSTTRASQTSTGEHPQL